MTIGSLFSGIGGLELGLEAAGFGPVSWQVEIDPFCRRVLAKHWPEADRSVSDVHLASASTLPRVDLICGGFPCQDVSAAGKRAGLAGKRSGLWYEYKRVVGELRPRLVVVENVASGARSWLCAVRSDLHELGYDTAALALGAEDVGAPHRRSRIFVVGFLVADGDGQGQRQQGRALGDVGRRTRDGGQAMADADCAELREQPRRGEGARGRDEASTGRTGEAMGHPSDEERGARGGMGRLARTSALGAGGGVVDTSGERWREGRPESAREQGRSGVVGASLRHAQPSVRRGSDGLPSRVHGGGLNGIEQVRSKETCSLASEDVRQGLPVVNRADQCAEALGASLAGHRWPAGRGPYQHDWEPSRTVAPRTVPDRVARVKALGNAVVPQCALVVGRWIMEARP